MMSKESIFTRKTNPFNDANLLYLTGQAAMPHNV